jgi:hypothetical protein
MDPYAYVQGLVESATDPSGQAYARALEGFGGATGVGAATLAVPALFVFFPQGTTPTGSLTPAAGAAAAAAAAAAYQPGDAIATHTIALAGGQVETVTLYGDRIDVTVVSAQGQLVSSTTYLPNQTEYITALHQFDGDAAGAASDATDQAGVRAAEAQAGIPVAGTTGAKPSAGLGGVTNLIHVVTTLAAALFFADKQGSPPPSPPSAYPQFRDPTQSPGPDWVWSPPGSQAGVDQGNWHNPGTLESWHPDLDHPAHDPRWDYAVRKLKPRGWRWYEDGHWEEKSR